MRTVRVHEFGDASVLRVESIAAPEPGPEEVLVEVHAAGVNPYDWMTRDGDGATVSLPWIPGWDLSGVVVEVGDGVTGFDVGDEVFTMLADQRGAYAEAVAVPATNLLRKPTGLSHVEAAAVPMVSLTAWQALFDHGGLTPARRVLIHAAAGGVGHIAVQLADWIGAETVGTASGANREFLEGLVLDEFVDYREVDFETAVEPVDLVIDAVGGDTTSRSLAVLRSGGHLVTLPRPLTEGHREELAAQGATGSYPVSQWRPEQLRTVGMLVDRGDLAVRVGREFDLESVREAHSLSESRHAKGKIVLQP